MKIVLHVFLYGFILLLSISWYCPISAQDTIPWPCLNNGKKWRIGYYEGGPWQDYTIPPNLLKVSDIVYNHIDASTTSP